MLPSNTDVAKPGPPVKGRFQGFVHPSLKKWSKTTTATLTIVQRHGELLQPLKLTSWKLSSPHPGKATRREVVWASEKSNQWNNGNHIQRPSYGPYTRHLCRVWRTLTHNLSCCGGTHQQIQHWGTGGRRTRSSRTSSAAQQAWAI